VVVRLDRMGLIVRETCKNDLRTKHVSLSPRGRRVVEQVMAVHGQQIRSVMCGLSEDQQRELSKLLSVLRVHLEELVERGPAVCDVL
jgi:MarR family 2-MHQ and catechol resistance regulon transcriptional repressor